MSALVKLSAPVALATLALANSRADTPFDRMLSRVPEQANILLVADNDAVQKSPLGVSQNWAKNYQKSALGGLFGSPPHLLRLVLAAQIDHYTLGKQWEIGVADLRYDITNKNLVESTRGARDSVGGREVTLTPQNTFLVLFNQHQVGMMSPPNRQSFSRWLRTTDLKGGTRLSPFLRQAMDSLPKDAQAQLAIDMNDMFDAKGLQERLKNSKPLQDAGIDVEAASKLFTGVRGLTLALRIRNSIEGELRIYFDDPPTFLQPVAKAMLTGALTKMGASIDDFDSWETSTDANAIVMRGKLSQSSVRRIVSPLYQPISLAGNKDDADDSPVTASKRYFVAVNTLLEDLKSTKAKSLSQRSLWYKQFADKIDGLPMLNVDEELLHYGAAVSSTLRGLANFASNTKMQQRTIAGNTYEFDYVTPGGAYYYGNGAGWGYNYSLPAVQTYSNEAQNRNLIARAGNTEAAVRNETWKNIEAATTQIRNKMTQKYRVEFQ